MLLAWGLLLHLRSPRPLHLACETCAPPNAPNTLTMLLEWVDCLFVGIFLGLMDRIKDLSIMIPSAILLLPPIVTKFHHLERLWVERRRCGSCGGEWQPSPCDLSQDYIVDFINENRASKATSPYTGCNLDALWKTRAEIGGTLQTLETHASSIKAFVNFLSSFSGSQCLHIYHFADNPNYLSPIVMDAFTPIK